MANKHYTLSIQGNFMLDVSSALQDKYGTGVTIYYIDTLHLVFYCPAISDKVIKIVIDNSGTFLPYFFYGDSWTSNSTITNQVQFAGKSYATGFAPSDLVLGDSFALFSIPSTSDIRSILALIGKTTNDSSIVIGMAGTSSSSTLVFSIGKNITTGASVFPITFGGGFRSSSKLYKQPIIFADAVNGEIELNGDNSFATIADLYNISYQSSATSSIITASSFFSPCDMFMADGIVRLQTCIFAEL